MRTVTLVGLVVVAVLLVAASGFTSAPAGEEQFSPVPFDQTLKSGLTGVDIQQAEEKDYAIPKGQVFYGQYQYVVGFYGTDSLVRGATQQRYTEQFGEPLGIYVTDYTGTNPTLTDGQYLRLSNSAAQTWTRAEDVYFVIETPARTPGGPTAVPFGDRDAAAAFAEEYDGEIVDWETLKERQPTTGNESADRLNAPTEQRQQWANESVERARETLDRPVSVTVGEDAETIEAAIEQAPPNTAVEIPAGRYTVDLNVSKSVTLSGAGNRTVLDGRGEGTVVRATAPRVGIESLRVTGVGDTELGSPSTDGETSWDKSIELVYGRGDAAIRLSEAPRSLVENVSVETSANGVIVHNSTGTVVRDIDLQGSDTWEEGSMGVLAMYSRMVVEDSTFDGGRDAVYTHYSNGLVVRDNRMQNMRYGVHQMYTSDALVLNNTIRQSNVGIILMTRPTGNAIVGNHLRGNDVGVITVGAASWMTENVAVDNDIGLSIGMSRSVVHNNTAVRNEVGVRSATLLPTNDVTGNDIVANDQPVKTDLGTLNIWTVGGRGNYWGPIPGIDRDGDGVVDRTYRPSDTVDRSAGDSIGARTLAQAPTLGGLRAFQRSVPGLRPSSIVDTAPLSEPVHPDRLDALNVSTEAR